MKTKYQGDFVIGKNLCEGFSGFRNLVSVNGEPSQAGTVVIIYVYSIQNRSRGHCIKESHPPFETYNNQNSVYHKGT